MGTIFRRIEGVNQLSQGFSRQGILKWKACKSRCTLGYMLVYFYVIYTSALIRIKYIFINAINNTVTPTGVKWRFVQADIY